MIRDFIIFFGLIFLFVGCGPGKNDIVTTEDTANLKICKEIGVYDIVIVVIDSCEYLRVNSSSSSFSLTHKGNCKFCKQRNELKK